MGHGELVLFAQNAGLRNLSKLDMMREWISARLMKMEAHNRLKGRSEKKRGGREKGKEKGGMKEKTNDRCPNKEGPIHRG